MRTRRRDGLIAWRHAFLIAGLVPSVWLTRRLPLGFFFMTGAWSLIAGGVLLVIAGPVAAARGGWGKTLAKTGGVVLALGTLLMVLLVAATLDARGDVPKWTDAAARAVGLALEMTAAFMFVRRAEQLGERRLAVAAPFLIALVAALLGATLGRRLPYWAIIPIIAAAAARLALLPLPSATSRPAGHGHTAMFVFFAWSTCVLALQSQVLVRPSGVVAGAVAFFVGLTVLAVTLRRRRDVRWVGVVPGIGVFVVAMFFFTLLMPSLAGYSYLFRIGLREPATIRLAGTVAEPGVFERWYETDLEGDAAIDLMSESFRSPPVSVWPDDSHSTTGLLFGYRLEVTYFDRLSHLPQRAACATELHSCIRVAVTRSDNWN